MNHLAVTCAIIRKDDKFLTAQRPLHKNQGGRWEFPGGKIHAGETAEECIVREIMEELGLRVIVRGRLHPVLHSYDTFDIELIPIVCAVHSGRLSLHEHISINWLNLQQLHASDLCEADKKILPQLRTLP